MGTSLFSKAALTVLMGAFCLLLGLSAAILPSGLVLRAAFALALVIFLLVAWLLRNNQTLPPKPLMWMLIATIALSVLWPRFIFFPAGGISINPHTLSVLAMFLICLFFFIANAGIAKSASFQSFSTLRLGWLIFAWFTWRLFSSFFGETPATSVISIIKEVLFSTSFLLITATLLTYPNADKWLLRVLVLSGLFVSVYGLAEAVTQKNFFVRFASGGATDAAAKALRAIASEKVREGAYRAQSFFTHPIVFAQFVGALLPLSLLLSIREGGRPIWRLIGLVTIPIATVAILKSGSRSGLVSILASVAFILFILWLRAVFTRGTPRILATLAVPAIAAAMVVIGYFAQDLLQGRSTKEIGSSQARVEMLNLGIKALNEHPILGYGDGLAIFVAGLTNSKGQTTIDSYFLSIAIDSGYPGLILLLSFILIFSFHLAFLAAKTPGIMGANVGLIACAVMSLFVSSAGLSIAHNMTLAWILISLGLFYARQVSSASPTSA